MDFASKTGKPTAAGFRTEATLATVGVILAGGAARRMGGGDKTLCRVGDKPILARVIARIERECVALALSANGDGSRFAKFGLPVLGDDVPERPGPMAGILAALEWAAAKHPTVRWLLSVPGDTPFLPVDLVSRLHAQRAAAGAEMAYAASGAFMHPTIAIGPVAAAGRLRHALVDLGTRRITDFVQGFDAARVEWEVGGLDPFTNINEPAELTAAQAVAGASP